MNDTLATLLFGGATLLFVLALLVAFTSIRRDVREMHREQKQGSWFRRPVIINSLAQSLLWIAIYLNVLILLKHFERWLYFPILASLIGAIFLCFYAIKLARALPRQKRPQSQQANK